MVNSIFIALLFSTLLIVSNGFVTSPPSRCSRSAMAFISVDNTFDNKGSSRQASTLKFQPDAAADILSASTEAISVGGTSTLTSVGPIDPAQLFTDVLGGLINSPAILLVPIGAAVAVASAVAFLIVSYANPEVEDDTDDNDDEF